MKKIERKLHKIDAKDQAPGRLASEIALVLRGKNKPEFEPYLDCGDMVSVTNIKNLKFTGKKLEQKKYYSYSGYQGGLKEKKMKDLNDQDPADILRRAVRDMLPPVKFRKEMMKRLVIN